jgi:putative restriction endonuclease
LKAFVGITDYDWFRFLSSQEGIDEVNFWQPSGNQSFKALHPGEPFLFKLHHPRNYIVGGGFFVHFSNLPVSLAWSSFQEKNGAASLLEMRQRIEKYRRIQPLPSDDYQIGCILLNQPFFFQKDQWIEVPADFKLNIVRGKSYDLLRSPGREMWAQVQLLLSGRGFGDQYAAMPQPRYGDPTLVQHRLGQGSFRIMVTDVYQRRCAVTQERTLPALEAAHIKPYCDSGPHSIDNGVLFRSDIHKLFDAGYVTIAPDYHFEVSHRIRAEFENGRDYYALNGHAMQLPSDERLWPKKEFLHWHNNKVFRS